MIDTNLLIDFQMSVGSGLNFDSTSKSFVFLRGKEYSGDVILINWHSLVNNFHLSLRPLNTNILQTI